jgi:hypothetical protein
MSVMMSSPTDFEWSRDGLIQFWAALMKKQPTFQSCFGVVYPYAVCTREGGGVTTIPLMRGMDDQELREGMLADPTGFVGTFRSVLARVNASSVLLAAQTKTPGIVPEDYFESDFAAMVRFMYRGDYPDLGSFTEDVCSDLPYLSVYAEARIKGRRESFEAHRQLPFRQGDSLTLTPMSLDPLKQVLSAFGASVEKIDV